MDNKNCYYPTMPSPHTTYTKEIGDEICSLLRQGFAPVEVWQKLGVSMHTARSWRSQHEEFAEKYNESIEIWYNLEMKRAQDEVVKRDNDLCSNDRGDVPNSAAVKRSELIANVIHQRLKLMNPDKYGDKYKSWLRDCPEFGNKITANERLQLVNSLVAKGKLSLEDSQKLLPLIDTQFRLDDMQRLSNDVAELKKMFEQKNNV